jgi:hypothetical protein
MEQISIYILWMNEFCGFNFFFLIFILPTYNVYNIFFIFRRLKRNQNLLTTLEDFLERGERLFGTIT